MAGGGGLGGRAQRLPPKADWKHLFYMQGAGLNMILTVYRLHGMHPGNIWNTIYILKDTYLYFYIYIYINIHLYIYMNLYIYNKKNINIISIYKYIKK